MSQLRSPFSAGFTASAADDLAVTLKALAEPTRLKSLALLHALGPQAPVDIEQELGTVAQPTLAHHLRILETAGLIASRKAGVYVIKALVPGRMAAIAHLLDPGAA